MTNAYYWSDAEKSAIAERLKEGWSSRMIGAEFKRSRNAIIGLVRRDPALSQIGLSLKPRASVPKDSVAYIHRKPGPKVSRTRPAFTNAIPPAEGGVDGGVTLTALKAGQCKWPINDAERGELHMFCGAASEGSYCPHHAARNIRRAA